MDLFRIEGGRPLQGTVAAGGAKNAALPIFAATLLTREPCRIDGVPDLTDIRFMAKILRYLGATVEQVASRSLGCGDNGAALDVSAFVNTWRELHLRIQQLKS